jgi:general L-amino acid transport system ATP-binding protein
MASPASESRDIIVCRDVHKWFDRLHVLKGINLSVTAGEVLVIFGPSGSGKSTFIRTINRLEAHQRGSIVVNGIELTNDVRNIHAVRTEIGMVFQQFNLFPHLTVLQNVTLAPIWVRRWPQEIPGAALGRPTAAGRHCQGAGHAAQNHAL